MAAPLAVDADLTVTVGGREYAVVGDGHRLAVEAPSLRAAREFGDHAATLPGSTEGLSRLAERTGLAVEVRVRGATVARVVPGVRPGPLSRWVGVAPASLDLAGVVAAALARLVPGR